MFDRKGQLSVESLIIYGIIIFVALFVTVLII